MKGGAFTYSARLAAKSASPGIGVKNAAGSNPEAVRPDHPARSLGRFAQPVSFPERALWVHTTRLKCAKKFQRQSQEALYFQQIVAKMGQNKANFDLRNL
jgi:hypothetical protein